MRAIIVAAGMGRRLAPHTDDRPKGLVEVGGRSILARQLDAYRAIGVDEAWLVRGYLGDRLTAALGDEQAGVRLRYVDNPDYRRNNILASLMRAEEAMAGGFCFSYSDIVFRPEVTAALAAAPGDFALVVDRRWADAYVGRTLHPESEAELALVDGAGRVARVGKGLVARDRAHGEFIGLARFSARAAEVMRRAWHELVRERGLDAPFGSAPRLEVAYVTDLLNHLIDRGEAMVAVDIDGGWREIDTPEDLDRARRIFDAAARP